MHIAVPQRITDTAPQRKNQRFPRRNCQSVSSDAALVWTISPQEAPTSVKVTSAEAETAFSHTALYASARKTSDYEIQDPVLRAIPPQALLADGGGRLR